MTQSTQAQPQTSAQHALAEHLRLTSEGLVGEWVKLFAPDAVLEFPYAPPGVPHQVAGHDALVAHMSNFPHMFDVDFVDIVFHDTTDPNVAIAEFRSEGTAIPTGKPYDQTCISVVHTDDHGLITRYLDYWNPLVAIAALKSDDAGAAADTVKFGT